MWFQQKKTQKSLRHFRSSSNIILTIRNLHPQSTQSINQSIHPSSNQSINRWKAITSDSCLSMTAPRLEISMWRRACSSSFSWSVSPILAHRSSKLVLVARMSVSCREPKNFQCPTVKFNVSFPLSNQFPYLIFQVLFQLSTPGGNGFQGPADQWTARCGVPGTASVPLR